MGFSRQECSGLPCPPPENLPNPGIEPVSLMSPALSGRFFTTGATWEAHWLCWHNKIFPNHTESLFPNRNNFFFWPCQEACRILIPPPGTEPGGHGSESAKSWPLDPQGIPSNIISVPLFLLYNRPLMIQMLGLLILSSGSSRLCSFLFSSLFS